jgi:checkpoint serine/threonine-protein kinase
LEERTPTLQLIDFGTAIDMEVYASDDQFNYVVKTENFTCCEMLENRPWTYQIDLFGVAGTAHVMLFGKYMKVEKRIGQWEIQSRFPRYFRKELWGDFFKTLLNIRDSETLPNLQELKASLDKEISERGNYISQKVAEFNSALFS